MGLEQGRGFRPQNPACLNAAFRPEPMDVWLRDPEKNLERMERTDLAAAPEHATTREELRQKMTAWFANRSTR